ncbi:EamA family transporter [Terrimonas sp. NA20]|uniref:EamA family transporter n=1 Tax=Terrimonas ginsenosidimutans TaxID=2908004 RepID=A0ABS9KQ47_9BACT|nr:EamA family transporter [Terrimonas ginsenosidimutans]MCG2614431.1 EamA family transporter [Terrimonas ginsenosidimutans]
MPRFDLYKTLSQTGNSVRGLSVFNPLTIRRKGTRAKAIFALAMVCFLWGTTWLASKQGVKYMPSLQMAGIRQSIGGLCYVIYFLSKGAKLPNRKEWVSIVILSLLNFALTNGLSTWGLQHITAGLGAIIGSIFPLWIVVIGLFTSSTKIPTKAIIGLLIGFAGICVVFFDHLSDFQNPDFRFGILISLAATWTWAFGTLYTKKKAASFNPYFSLGLQMVISGFILLVFTQVANTPSSKLAIPFSEIPWQSWASVGYLVLFGSLISFMAYLYALQNLPTEQASIYAYVNPVVAAMLGALLFSEKITLYIIAGGLVALAGVYLVNKAFKALPAVEQPEAEGI